MWFGFTGALKLDKAFKTQYFTNYVVFTAADSDCYYKLCFGLVGWGYSCFRWRMIEVQMRILVRRSRTLLRQLPQIGIRSNTFIRGYYVLKDFTNLCTH